MMGRTHTLIGTVAAAGLTQATHGAVDQEAVMVAAAFLTAGGPLSPDCDIYLPVEHRGPTHWLVTCAAVACAVGVVVGILAPSYALAAGLGVGVAWLAHDLSDALTVGGVPLLGPLFGHDFHLLPRALRFRVGHMQPVWCAVLFGAVAVFVAVVYVGA